MTLRTRRLGLVVALATGAALLAPGPIGALSPSAPKIGMVCTPGSVSGTTHTFNLRANTGYVQTPDGNAVFMWSYANADVPDNGAFQSPGPVLCVTQNEIVVVNLHNTLPEASSIVFPGQDTQVTATFGPGGGAAGLLTTEAAANGGDVIYTFTAGSPGTYLYESGSDISKQVEMGLYGALVVRPALGPDYAYDASTQFNASREYLLLLAEVDPALHLAVETGGTSYDFTTLHNRYFTINGRSFPDTIQDNASTLLPSQPYGALVRIQPTTAGSPPALVRMINAGADNHPFHPHGNHTREIAQDGRLLVGASGGSASSEHFGETIGSGQTKDYLLRWDNQTTDTAGVPFNDDWNPNTNQLPVAQPNYRNLTFKDSLTWYAGSPYLGYKGTLPTGTTSLNICGEWYFPFHSHALNEFTNFDEGFGGMGTLLRVDPAGGCFAFPTATKITTGTLNSGAVGNLAVDDASYYKVNSSAGTSDWYGQFSSIPAGAGNLKVTYKGNDNWSPYTQNFNTLATSGTSNLDTTLPLGWAFLESGTNAGTTYAAGTGSSGTADTYSFGSGTTSTDRAFGTLRGSGTNTFSSIIGAAFTNTTGGTITSLSISYTGEQWRRGANNLTPDHLDFEYSTNATSLATVSGTWTPVPSLNFNSPVVSLSGAPQTLNGNLAGNRTAKSATITGLSIAPGATYRIRWTDFDRGGSSVADDGLGVDDFSITPGGPTVSTTVYIWNWAGVGSWVQVGGSTPVGGSDVTVANNVAVPAPPTGGFYIGTGSNKGLVRMRVLSGPSGGANFVTGGNFMTLVYDAP